MDDAECYEYEYYNMTYIYCHFNVRTPVPTKQGQRKVEENSCISAVSRVYDSPTVTARYY